MEGVRGVEGCQKNIHIAICNSEREKERMIVIMIYEDDDDDGFVLGIPNTGARPYGRALTL